MRFFGTILLFIGIFSLIWYFVDANFLFLDWIDRWGITTGWFIRGGIILAGAIFYFLGKPSEEE